jgi:hypothetical protein
MTFVQTPPRPIGRGDPCASMRSVGYRLRERTLLMPDQDPLKGLGEDFVLGEFDGDLLGELDGDLFRDLEPDASSAAETIELERIPRRLWEQTLAPLRRQQRVWIAHQIRDKRLRELATDLVFEFDMDECVRRRVREEACFAARRTGTSPPPPDSDPAAIRSTVRIDVRLRQDDHVRLTQAATAVGLKPTTLARTLVLNGAARILREDADGSADRDVRRRTPGYP